MNVQCRVFSLMQEESHSSTTEVSLMNGHAFTTMINLPKAGDPSQAQLPEFPRHKLRVVEKLGEGAFGMVSNTESLFIN